VDAAMPGIEQSGDIVASSLFADVCIWEARRLVGASIGQHRGLSEVMGLLMVQDSGGSDQLKCAVV